MLMVAFIKDSLEMTKNVGSANNNIVTVLFTMAIMKTI